MIDHPLDFFGKEFLHAMAYRVTVEGRKCNGCEECLEACTVGLFRMHNGKAVAAEDKECMGCESCMGVCDGNAITVTDTRVALSNTCLHLLRALDDGDTEVETRRPENR
jgi:NAD-dependent dihydropyrimidine dehydrogenase PreA subunit